MQREEDRDRDHEGHILLAHEDSVAEEGERQRHDDLEEAREGEDDGARVEPHKHEDEGEGEEREDRVGHHRRNPLLCETGAHEDRDDLVARGRADVVARPWGRRGVGDNRLVDRTTSIRREPAAQRGELAGVVREAAVAGEWPSKSVGRAEVARGGRRAGGGDGQHGPLLHRSHHVALLAKAHVDEGAPLGLGREDAVRLPVEDARAAEAFAPDETGRHAAHRDHHGRRVAEACLALLLMLRRVGVQVVEDGRGRGARRLVAGIREPARGRPARDVEDRALEGDDLGELCRAEDVAALEGVIEDRDVVQATDTLLLRFVVLGEEAATIIFGEAAVARPTGVAIVARLARSRELLIEERALVLPTGGHREPKVPAGRHDREGRKRHDDEKVAPHGAARALDHKLGEATGRHHLESLCGWRRAGKEVSGSVARSPKNLWVPGGFSQDSSPVTGVRARDVAGETRHCEGSRVGGPFGPSASSVKVLGTARKFHFASILLRAARYSTFK